MKQFLLGRGVYKPPPPHDHPDFDSHPTIKAQYEQYLKEHTRRIHPAGARPGETWSSEVPTGGAGGEGGREEGGGGRGRPPQRSKDDWAELLNRHKQPRRAEGEGAPRANPPQPQATATLQAGEEEDHTQTPPMPEDTYTFPLAPELPLQPYTELHATPYLSGYWVTIYPPTAEQEAAADAYAAAAAAAGNPAQGMPPCTEGYLYRDDLDPRLWTMHIHETPSRLQLQHIPGGPYRSLEPNTWVQFHTLPGGQTGNWGGPPPETTQQTAEPTQPQAQPETQQPPTHTHAMTHEGEATTTQVSEAPDPTNQQKTEIAQGATSHHQQSIAQGTTNHHQQGTTQEDSQPHMGPEPGHHTVPDPHTQQQPAQQQQEDISGPEPHQQDWSRPHPHQTEEPAQQQNTHTEAPQDTHHTHEPTHPEEAEWHWEQPWYWQGWGGGEWWQDQWTGANSQGYQQQQQPQAQTEDQPYMSQTTTTTTATNTAPMTPETSTPGGGQGPPGGGRGPAQQAQPAEEGTQETVSLVQKNKPHPPKRRAKAAGPKQTEWRAKGGGRQKRLRAATPATPAGPTQESTQSPHLEAMTPRERALHHIDTALADVNPSNGTDTAAHLHACKAILHAAGENLGHQETPPAHRPQLPQSHARQQPHEQPGQTQTTGGEGGRPQKPRTSNPRALELDEAARQTQLLLEQDQGTPTGYMAQHLATIQELIMRGIQRMGGVRRVHDWQIWGGGETAGQVGLELTQQLLHELNTAGDTKERNTDRQQQHQFQAALREILTHIHQAIEAHEVVVEAEWLEPADRDAAPAQRQHPEEEGVTKAHPADVISLAKGGTESHSDRTGPTHHTDSTGVTTARGLLARLMPFLVQEEAAIAAQAINALDDWLHAQWGEPIVLLESQRAGERLAASTEAEAAQTTEDTGEDTPDTIQWPPPPPVMQEQPAAASHTNPESPTEQTTNMTHGRPPHTQTPPSPHPPSHAHHREPTEEFTSSQSEGEEREEWGGKRPRGWGLQRRQHHVQERLDSRRRRTHEGASSD